MHCIIIILVLTFIDTILNKNINLKNKDMKKKKKFCMQYDKFIQAYILPNENKETILKYYNNVLEFDKYYLLEVAKHYDIIIKDL